MKAHLAEICISAKTRTLIAALVGLLYPAFAVSGIFGVSPIRVDFDRSTRTGLVTVSNEDEEKPLRAQVEAFSWTQDEEGKDRYEVSSDLIFLPRIMNVPAKENQLVRLGIRQPAADHERAYRLFIEEVPEPRKPGEAGAQVAVKVRFGIPVFVKPLQERPKGEISSVSLDKGALAVAVKNTGNVHFRIESIRLRAGAGFSQELTGWYLLPGASRIHTATIPEDLCSKLGTIEVLVKTDRLELVQKEELSAASCR